MAATAMARSSQRNARNTTIDPPNGGAHPSQAGPPGEDAVARANRHAIRAADLPSEALATEGSQDRWPSGLRHTLGKRAWCNSHRGFESRPVRHAHVALHMSQ